MSDQTAPTSEVLNRAADLIEERGWAQGVDVNPFVNDGPFCASTAIREAHPASHCKGYDALSQYLGAPGVVLSVIAWNDRPERTASEVIEALRACAVIEESHEREAAAVAS